VWTACPRLAVVHSLPTTGSCAHLLERRSTQFWSMTAVASRDGRLGPINWGEPAVGLATTSEKGVSGFLCHVQTMSWKFTAMPLLPL
jgi:hypothetical protein